MQESYRFSHDLSGVDELLDAGSYMDDTSSMFGFESDYLLSEVDDGSIATYEKMCEYRRELDFQMMMMEKMFDDQIVRDREIERYFKQNEGFDRRAGGYGPRTRRNPLHRPSADPLLLMPIGEVHSNDLNVDKLSGTSPNEAINQVHWGVPKRVGSSQIEQLHQ